VLVPGKLPPELLRELLERYARPDSRVLIGPGVGRDAAVIDFGDRLLVAKTDPITFAADQIGWYAVHVNANDVATTGARPRWFLATVLLPETGTGEGLARTIFRQMHEACEGLGVSLCGGHTEVTLGIDRPIVAGMMLGEVSRDGLVRADGAKAGDRILLTQGIAIEGTAVLAQEHPEAAGLLRPDQISACGALLRRPGISVVEAGLTAAGAARVHAMHDPTEGGVATALWEMAEASGVGLRVNREAVPVYPETRRICEAFDLDPLGLLASGALLIAVAPEDAKTVLQALERKGIPGREIGEVLDAGEGVLLLREGCDGPMPVFPRDEVARALSG
jgi:hydrogenase maturation factor